MHYSEYEQHAIDAAFTAQEDRRTANRTVLAAFREEVAERRALGIYADVPVAPPEDWERAHREMEARDGGVPPPDACPGCGWPYASTGLGDACPLCRAEDAEAGEG